MFAYRAATTTSTFRRLPDQTSRSLSRSFAFSQRRAVSIQAFADFIKHYTPFFRGDRFAAGDPAIILHPSQLLTNEARTPESDLRLCKPLYSFYNHVCYVDHVTPIARLWHDLLYAQMPEPMRQTHLARLAYPKLLALASSGIIGRHEAITLPLIIRSTMKDDEVRDVPFFSATDREQIYSQLSELEEWFRKFEVDNPAQELRASAQRIRVYGYIMLGLSLLYLNVIVTPRPGDKTETSISPPQPDGNPRPSSEDTSLDGGAQ